MPEAARIHRDWWLGLSGEERLEHMQEFKARINAVRMQRIRRMHPGASDAEVDAIWLEETYKDDLDPHFLRAAQHAIRTRDEPREPTS